MHHFPSVDHMTFYKNDYIYLHIIDGEKLTNDFPGSQHGLNKKQKRS